MASLDLGELFPFELDQFQHDAIDALNGGKSVVVCAPTGSGKTLIGEYAIHRALANNRRVFYTTPLKALSNQKLRNFRDQFGEDNVGLLTGDISVNRDAPIIVMTTEIFRNMLYGTPIGEVGTSLVGLEAVVLDECHYMNDRQRGTVWEESIIYCPAEIQLVALSATVANSRELTDWISRVHGQTELIYSDFRPVPLQFHFCDRRGLFPLLEDNQTEINHRLKPGYIKDKSKDKAKTSSKDSRGDRPERQEAPALSFVVSQLHKRDMLPAIYFIFSRRGCDRAVTDMGELSLLNELETQQLKHQIDAFLKANPDAGRSGQVSALYHGIAAHHAGILPAWKGLVEELFQQGLIKVVFATETLAAGINMPARTTVISSLSKRTDNGHRLLTASEFLQMSGRAGRRGMDAVGYMVTVQTPFEGAREAAHLATSKPDPLVSQFTPSYGMVLNLLQTHSIEEARELIERSFGQYLSELALAPKEQELDEMEVEIANLETDLAKIDLKSLASYEKLRDRLREERRLLKILAQQADEKRLKEIAAYFPFVLTGSSITIKSSKGMPISGVVAAKVPGSGKFPWLVVLGKDNYWHIVTSRDVLLLGDVWTEAEIAYPIELAIKAGQSCQADPQSESIVNSIPTLAMPELAPEVQQQQQKVLEIEANLASHPLQGLSDKANLTKKARRLEQLQRTLTFQRQVLTQKRSHNRDRYWREFLDLVNILKSSAPDQARVPASRRIPASLWENQSHELKLTKLGEIAASLRGDNELWLALVLDSGYLDNLEPQQLATICAVLVTEDNSRPENWNHLGISPEVEEAIDHLREMKRKLIRSQDSFGVTLPVWLEYNPLKKKESPFGLIENWALGMEWKALCRQTSLDEGDIVRMVRRTNDLLCQIPYAPYLPDSLRNTARQAIQLIDRFPVSEIA